MVPRDHNDGFMALYMMLFFLSVLPFSDLSRVSERMGCNQKTKMVYTCGFVPNTKGIKPSGSPKKLSRSPQEALKKPSGSPKETLRKSSGCPQEALRMPSGRLQEACPFKHGSMEDFEKSDRLFATHFSLTLRQSILGLFLLFNLVDASSLKMP